MDSITHLFLGGAIAAAIAPAKYRRAALLAGAVINTLPDLDVLPLALVEDPVMVMTWHRGATHSLLVLPWVAALLWWLLKLRWPPVREQPLRWFWLVLAVLTNVFVPQLETVNWSFPVTVAECVLMARSGRRLPWPSRDERAAVARVLDRLGIGALGGRHIRELYRAYLKSIWYWHVRVLGWPPLAECEQKNASAREAGSG